MLLWQELDNLTPGGIHADIPGILFILMWIFLCKTGISPYHYFIFIFFTNIWAFLHCWISVKRKGFGRYSLNTRACSFVVKLWWNFSYSCDVSVQTSLFTTLTALMECWRAATLSANLFENMFIGDESESGVWLFNAWISSSRLTD